MKFLSVCSGIEAASAAWSPLGWSPIAFSEIDKFPSAALAHHHPDVPNWGDMNSFRSWPDASFDVLVGGTPCQSFSIAGLREGLDDPRGNLALVYLAILDRYRPRWMVWENVPGVLSSNGGRDFGTFLAGLGELGYGFAYRVLDAQFFGVPQRRRRVFVVGYLGDWRRAAAVLFEPEGLRGDPPPRRRSREETSGTLTRGLGERGAESAERDLLIAEGGGGVTHTLRGDGFDASEDGTGRGTPLVPTLLASPGDGRGIVDPSMLVAGTLQASPKSAGSATQQDAEAGLLVPVSIHENQRGELSVSETAGALKAGGGKPGQGFPAVMVSKAFGGNNTRGPIEVATALKAHESPHGRQDFESDTFILHAPPVADPVTANEARTYTHEGEHNFRTRNVVATVCLDEYNQAGHEELCYPLRTATGDGIPKINLDRYGVRRLTPRECERLQGFPDDFTLIPFNGKPVKDGPRYKALGNSMAVPVMAWIGRRIALVDSLLPPEEPKP